MFSRPLVATVFVVLGCGGEPSTPDGSVPDDGRAGCTRDVDCDDSRFCNGAERCDDAGRCVDGESPCGPGTSCVESARRCELGCTTDADGDGVIALACGGTDCDDGDPNRNPGATEVCDPENVDEDCDPSTVGGLDDDDDGFDDAACCNELAGVLRCGTDCDDDAANVSPNAPEVCDEVDNDCDGSVDEGVAYTLWSDVDRDGFGDALSSPTRSCRFVPGSAIVGDDCDDQVATTNPGVHDLCNGVDDDCDDAIDEGSDDFCRATLGVVDAACIQLTGEPAPRCVVTRCEPTRIDCNLDPSDGCEADFCTELAHCGACGGIGPSCAAGFCNAGRCAPSAVSIHLVDGVVRRDRDDAPIAGASVSRFRSCGGLDATGSDATGAYSLAWEYERPFVLFLTQAAGYASQLDGPDSRAEIRLLEVAELDAILDASPVPVDRRLGIVVVDVQSAGIDLVEPISGTYLAPTIPSSPSYDLALPDGRTRRVFVNVRPGTARVRAAGAGDARNVVECTDGPGGPAMPIWHDTVVTNETIVHLQFGVCSLGSVGG
jgi:hypothetical protein